MTPTQKGRFCDSCAKEVKDFSRSEPDEIAEVILNSSTKVCGRFRKDQLSSSAPKLIDLIPIRPSHAAKVAAAALAFFSYDVGLAQGEPWPTVRGKVACTPMQQENSKRTIRGVVMDENGEKLAFVSISYQTDHGATLGVYTDLEGKFELVISSADVQRKQLEIHAAYVGYEKQILSIELKEVQYIEIRFNGSDVFLQGLMIVSPPASQNEAKGIEKEFNRIKNGQKRQSM